jgi:hypothetical protein
MNAWEADNHLVAEAKERVVRARRGNWAEREGGPARKLLLEKLLHVGVRYINLVGMHFMRWQMGSLFPEKA